MWAVGLVGQHERLWDLGKLILVHFVMVICNVEQLLPIKSNCCSNKLYFKVSV